MRIEKGITVAFGYGKYFKSDNVNALIIMWLFKVECGNENGKYA